MSDYESSPIRPGGIIDGTTFILKCREEYEKNKEKFENTFIFKNLLAGLDWSRPYFLRGNQMRALFDKLKLINGVDFKDEDTFLFKWEFLPNNSHDFSSMLYYAPMTIDVIKEKTKDVDEDFPYAWEDWGVDWVLCYDSKDHFYGY